MSNNCLEFLPTELSDLPALTHLNVSHNQLDKAARSQWGWITGSILGSLRVLDLSDNNLTYLSDSITRLRKLNELKLDNNKLTVLPYHIGKLKHLKIFTVAHNLLTSLPGTVKYWNLDEMDISGNNFLDDDFIGHQNVPKTVRSLREMVALQLLKNYKDYLEALTPPPLMRYLDSARYCWCGLPCLESSIRGFEELFPASICKDYKPIIFSLVISYRKLLLFGDL